MEVSICDERPGGERRSVLTIDIDTPAITIAELIRARIELELEQLEAARAGAEADGRIDQARLRARVSQFLVVPDDIERALNGDRGAYGPGTRALPRKRDESGAMCVDSEAMVEVALSAFRRGGFFVLTGERQLLDLDEEIDIAETTDLTFLKLTPLQGG